MRVNHRIKVPRVRLINADGSMVGIVDTRNARTMAEEQHLDLVEVQPMADPPVCRIMDFGKFRYEESRKERQARKHSHANAIKEVKFHASIGEHDYATKLTHIRDFLTSGYKVKVTLTYRGRENVHRELGFQLVEKVMKDCLDVCTVESAPRLMGRNLIALLAGKASKA
jgi:translation initiation factor IF-3